MTRTAPYLTLGTVLALGGGLIFANGVAAPAGPGGAAPVVAAAPGAAPPPVPAPAAPAVGAPAVGAPSVGAPSAGAPPAGAPPAGEAAPGGAPAEPAAGDAVFAGLTEDGEMTVAIAVRGDRASAYVCGAGLEVWLEGSVSAAGELDLTSASGLSTVTGTAEAGTFQSEGVRRDYTAEAVTPGAEVRDDVQKLLDRIGSS